MHSDRRQMTQTDYMSWRMEADPILRSTIVAVALLDRSPDQDRVVAMMHRATQRIPLLRSKAIPDKFGVTPPTWVDDPDFDLAWHLRRFTLPTGAGWDGALDVARIAAMTAFDKERPLWEFTVLDGLDDGRAALVIKVHHSLTDGVGGMQLIEDIVDRTRDGSDTAHDIADTAHDIADTGTDTAEPAAPSGTGTVRAALVAAAELTSQGMALARDPLGTLRGTATLARSTLRLTRPVLTTLSPVMTERSTRRRLATFDVGLPALRNAADAAGGSLNDVFIAAVLIGSARYHRRHGADVDRLRVTMPISLRTDHDEVGGNRISLARIELPTDVADPTDLIARVHTIVDSWRREPAVAMSPTVVGALNLLPASVLGGVLSHVDFVASNVTGSPAPMFAAGARILGYHAFSPTLGTAFNVTMLSYTSRCGVGINADASAVPDVDVLAECLADGFTDVLALCPKDTDATVAD